MSDELRRRRSELLAKRDALRADAVELAARIHEIRVALGNPFFYSKPEHPDESEANYTGHESLVVILPTILELKRVNEAIAAVEGELARKRASKQRKP